MCEGNVGDCRRAVGVEGNGFVVGVVIGEVLCY